MPLTLFIELVVAFFTGVVVVSLWWYHLLTNYDNMVNQLEEDVQNLEREIHNQQQLLDALQGGHK